VVCLLTKSCVTELQDTALLDYVCVVMDYTNINFTYKLLYWFYLFLKN